MGCKELIESLHVIRDEKIEAIWTGVQEEALTITEETARRREELVAELERKKAEITAEKYEQAVSEANNVLRSYRLAAEQEVLGRLFALAVASLGRARGEAYPGVFRALAHEIPTLDWRTVRVNPADAQLAREQFPDAEIVPDDGIAGGFEATAVGGTIRVDNTFEKRLGRIWPEIVPEMMKELHEELARR